MILQYSYRIGIFANPCIVVGFRVNYIMLFLCYVPQIVEGVKIQHNFRHFAVPRVVVGVKIGKKGGQKCRKIALYVCSVHRGMFSTSGNVQYIRVFSTSGGYHEYIGGYHEYIGGVQYIGGYHEYMWGIS